MNEPAELIGRASELAELERYFAEARAGNCVVAVVSGAMGMGTSSMLAALRQRHQHGTLVLRGAGMSWESADRFGLLEQLLTGHDGAPTAMELADLSPADAGRRVTSWLHDRLTDAGCLVLIDNSQDVDDESLQALVSALHRLDTAPILLLLAVDPTRPGSLGPGAQGMASLATRQLVLRGLSAGELRRLARETGVELDQQSAATLARQTQGSPGVVLRLLAEWEPQPSHRGPLGVPASITSQVERRLAAVSASARELAEGASVLGLRAGLGGAAALIDLADPVPALDELCRARLVRVEGANGGTIVIFTDELTRDAVYASAGPLRRRELHLAASRLADTDGERLRHRVAAEPKPDTALSAQLERCAEDEGGLGQWAAAAQSLLMASRISTEPADSDRRLYLGVEALIGAGRVIEAVDFLSDVEARPASSLRDAALGYLAVSRGRADEADRYLRRAWTAAQPSGSAAQPVQAESEAGVQVAAMVARHRVLDRLSNWDPEGMLSWSDEATRYDPGGVHELESQAMIGLALGMSGRLAQARAHYDRLVEEVGDSPQWQRIMLGRGWLDLASGDLTQARRALESSLFTTRRGGSARVALWARGWLARTYFTLGDWDGALACVEEGLWTLGDSGIDLLRPFLNWTGVQVHALRGQEEAALEYLRRMDRTANEYVVMSAPTRIATAAIAEAKGDHEEVVRALRPLAELPGEHALNQPGYWPWAHTYAEALVITGQLDAAEEFLPLREQLSRDRGHRGALSRLAIPRARLMVARGDMSGAEAFLNEAITAATRRPAPYELARLRYVAGQIVRRAGHRRKADALLTDARHGFAALGAVVEVQRCDQELRAGGQRRESGPHFDLTPQEQTVAGLVASGLSNREVAAELFLSVKTVQFHLTRIYNKLGVRSRTELAARMHEEA
ncbi:MAG: LuxR C-terminal-related transcriptional regulator [Actinomycetales bacterium]